jgi:hypothetical protein
MIIEAVADFEVFMADVAKAAESIGPMAWLLMAR